GRTDDEPGGRGRNRETELIPGRYRRAPGILDRGYESAGPRVEQVGDADIDRCRVGFVQRSTDDRQSVEDAYREAELLGFTGTRIRQFAEEQAGRSVEDERRPGVLLISVRERGADHHEVV